MSDNTQSTGVQASTVDFTIEDCTISLSGKVDRHTVPLLIRGIDLNRMCKDHFSIDFTAVSSVDTAGLAWLLKVMAQGRQAGQVVELKSVPAQLMSLARISDVEPLLNSV
ncbi:MAG: phospholipid transport system transporter-binding protein [Alteromonadaceae bacterium]